MRTAHRAHRYAPPVRTRRYVVFDPQGDRRRRSGGPHPSGTPVPAKWTLAVEELTVAQVARHRSLDRRIAPLVPMRLLRPVAMASTARPAAAGASWGVRAVGCDTSPFTGAGVRVAILDTGIDKTHE